VNVFRRLPLSRLLLLCGLVLAIGVSATALAFALGAGPTPPAKPLAEAVHGALAAPPVQGVSANVTLTDHLLEGANLATGGPGGGGGGGGGALGEVASSPLLAGGSGRLWISNDGRVRLELQAEKGDTQIIYDGHTVTIYDAATNTLYRYTPKQEGTAANHDSSTASHEPPSVAKIEEGIAHVREHAQLSGATPTDVAGQPAYTVRVGPKEGGSLIGGAELSFDSVHGVPLRAAIYSSTSSSPVIELAATEVSYGQVASSVFEFTPPKNAKVEEVKPPEGGTATATAARHRAHKAAAPAAGKPKLAVHGHGITGIAVLESPTKAGAKQGSGGAAEGLPKVNINGTSASELRTALGTILMFERSSVRYVVAGPVSPAAVEALARGL